MNKAKSSKKDSPIEWKCRNCDYIYEGNEALEKCLICEHPKSYYEVCAKTIESKIMLHARKLFYPKYFKLLDGTD